MPVAETEYVSQVVKFSGGMENGHMIFFGNDESITFNCLLVELFD